MQQEETLHRGKLLKEIIKKSGAKVSDVANRAHYNRGTLYRWFEQENLDWQILFEVASVCGYNIADQYPEAAEYRRNNLKMLEKSVFSEPKTSYGKEEKKDDEPLQSKYIKLLEELSNTQGKLLECQEKYFDLKERFEVLEGASNSGTQLGQNR